MMGQRATLERALDALRAVCSPVSGQTVQAAGQSINFFACPAVPAQDPEAWRAPFVDWLDSQCMQHQRAFGGLVIMHVAFCEWDQARCGVPCTRDTFAALLADMGYLIGEIEGTLLVSGLILKEDATASSMPIKGIGNS